LFKFQDEIALKIVSVIEPQLVEAETKRVRSKPTESLDAYDCILRALSLQYSFDRVDFHEAGRYIDRALELDPSYAQACAYKAWWHLLASGEGLSSDFKRDVRVAEEFASRSVSLDATDALTFAVSGHVQTFLLRQPERAVELFERALQLNPNSAFAWGVSASTYCFLGRPDEALERLRNAWRLSPFDPLNFFYWTVAGLAEFVAGRYDQGVGWLQKARRENPRFIATHRTLAACLGLLGEDQGAKAVAASLLSVDPSFRVSVFSSWYPLRRPDDLKRLVEGLRAAGLPE
jgi:tetratricopeptide (TPR) repeat protein